MATRNTFQRELVLRAAEELANHPTPEEIYNRVRRSCPTISKGTVYRNIGVLCDEGLLRRVEIPNSSDRVDCRTDSHYHLLCTECGRVFDVEYPPLVGAEASVAKRHGVFVASHDLLFKGVCAECCAKKA